MKILVTGANGYLGQGIVKKLYEAGHNVIATSLNINNITSDVEKIPVDLFSVDDPYNYFGKPDVVLHLAWRDGFIHDSKAHVVDLPKHYEFLNKMVESGVSKVSVMGSMHEIGFYEGSIDSQTPCFPETPYGISKIALRQFLIFLAEKNNTTWQWLRGYYIVGNSKYGSSIFSKITQAVRQGKKTFPFTMGQNQYDFLNYEDFCKQVVATVSQDKINGIINICSGKPEKLADRVEKFIRENGYDIKLDYGAFPDRPYDSKAVWGNNTKILEILRND